MKQFTLFKAFLTNEERLLRDFYVSEYPKTKYYILKHGGSLENAKDIFQEAYFACWKKISSKEFVPDSRSQIEAYLFTAAKNKWKDQMRKGKRKKKISLDHIIHNLVAEEGTTLADMEIQDKRLTITLEAFENLGEACRNLLSKFYYEKLSIREIALDLEIEEASAKNKKYRCIQKLRNLTVNKEER